MKIHSVLSIAAILISVVFSTGCDKTEILYAGRFTKGDEKGLNIFEFNTRNGSLTLKSQEDVGPSPSFFCLSKNKDLLYVINEVMEFKGNFGGGLTTLSINPETGAIAEKINEMLIPWAGPCYISLSADTKHLLIANYPNGSVVVVKLNNKGIPETISDTILYVKEEPDRSHAHMIQHDPSGKFIYVADLGLDRIIAYEFDTVNGKLIELVQLKKHKRFFTLFDKTFGKQPRYYHIYVIFCLVFKHIHYVENSLNVVVIIHHFEKDSYSQSAHKRFF